MRSHTRTSRRILTVLMAAVVLLSLAVVPSTAGNGNGGGNGGGGGNGDGGDGGGGGKGGTYAELVVAYRDVLGLPILAEFTTVEGTEHCVQPVTPYAIDGLTQVQNPVDGSWVTLIPLLGEFPTTLSEDELEVCDPHPDYAGYVVETELERLNQGRSPEDVVEQQYTEVQAMITDAELSLEASGRLVADGTTIDSPLMNTAIYLHLMLDGELTDVYGDPVALPEPSIVGYDYDARHHAAVALGMAAGKEVPMNVDTFVYHNRVLDIPSRTTVWTTVTGMRECTLGTYTVADRFTTCGLPGETYLDYTGFTYDRAATFTGCVTHHPDIMTPAQVDPIIDVVFGEVPNVTASNVHGVALHGDDARRVNLWFHDYDLLVLDWDAPGEDTCSEQETALTATP